MNLEELRRKREALDSDCEQIFDHMQALIDESERVADVAHNARQINDDLEREFELKTGLDKTDVAFLFFATALQCVRQYFLTPFTQRVDDQTAAKAVKGDKKESSDRSHKLYNPTLIEICENPVPFDANNYSELLKRRGDRPLKGGNHRYVTLGHDPILGFIFGTANIATSTLTTWDLSSYHIKTGQRRTRNPEKFANVDMLTYKADTRKVFSYTFDKLLNQGIEGKKLIAASLVKEYVHLRSDISSTISLPIPIISRFSPELAIKLADYGVDTGHVIDIAKQAVLAQAINLLIMMLHGMCFYLQDQKETELLKLMSYRNITTHKASGYIQLDLHKVKTRKILLYSNMIASASNVIGVAVAESMGQNAVRYLDVGGIAVTLYRLINDREFIRKVKEEFIQQRWHEMIQGDEGLYDPSFTSGLS